MYVINNETSLYQGNDSDDEKIYCVETICPSPNCTDPIVPDVGCPYCKGILIFRLS